MSHTPSSTQRRGFLGGIAGGAAALVVGRWSNADPQGLALTAPPSDAWIARIKGKYRQVFDNTSPNEGWGAAFPLNFIDSTKEAMKVSENADITAVSVFRHFAMPLLLNDAVWAKYHIGEMLNVKDPKTSAFATRNIFRDAVPLRDGLTYEKEMASGVIFARLQPRPDGHQWNGRAEGEGHRRRREERIRSRAACRGRGYRGVGRVRRQSRPASAMHVLLRWLGAPYLIGA